MTENMNRPNGYSELANRTYKTMVDAFWTANHRAFDFVHQSYRINAKPWDASDLESLNRERFERGDKWLELAANHVQTTGQHARELSEKFAAEGEAIREIVQSAQETATRQVDGFAKRVDAVTKR